MNRVMYVPNRILAAAAIALVGGGVSADETPTRFGFVALCGRRPWLPLVAEGLSCAPSTCCFLLQFGAWWAAMVLTWRAAVSAIVFL